MLHQGSELLVIVVAMTGSLGERAAGIGIGGGELDRGPDGGRDPGGPGRLVLAGFLDRDLEALPAAAELRHHGRPSPARKSAPVSGTLSPGNVTRRLPLQRTPARAANRAVPEKGAGGLTEAQVSERLRWKAEAGAPAWARRTTVTPSAFRSSTRARKTTPPGAGAARNLDPVRGSTAFRTARRGVGPVGIDDEATAAPEADPGVRQPGGSGVPTEPRALVAATVV
jgi:hypothetical protein